MRCPLSRHRQAGRTFQTQGLQGDGVRPHGTDAPDTIADTCSAPSRLPTAPGPGSQPLGGVQALCASTLANSSSQPPDTDTHQAASLSGLLLGHQTCPHAGDLAPAGSSTQNTVSRTFTWLSPASHSGLHSERPPQAMLDEASDRNRPPLFPNPLHRVFVFMILVCSLTQHDARGGNQTRKAPWRVSPPV